MTLVKGLYFKEKHPKSPDFVIANLSAKREDLIKFLQEQKGEWVNMQILMSKSGKPYVALDEWKPKNKNVKDEIVDVPEEEVKLSDIAF